MCGCGGRVWLLGGCAWLWGACVVAGGVCVVLGGVHGCGGHAWLWGACIGYDEIRSMSGQYASYWNAFLYTQMFILASVPLYRNVSNIEADQKWSL